MISRICDLPLNRSFFLLGPRQAGKSTLVNSAFTRKVWKINLLMTDQFLKYSKHPERLRLEALEKIERDGIRRIFIDEIQRVPELLNEVHFLIEKTECQFLMTSSSARKLRKGGVNLLAGRAVQRRLFPFVYQEIADSFSLDEVLQFGSLPAIYGRNQQEKFDILNSYTETYLREEIHAEGLVRNLGGFSRLLDLAASQCGELISFTSIGGDCHVATRTVQAYYDILEDTLISIRLQPWRKSIRKRMVSHAKFYLFDLGITNSLTRQLTAPPDPVRRGRLFEQFIILETYRLLHYRQSEACIYFWRTNHGAEVDLIIEKYGKIIGAFEIKSRSHITGAHLTGLRSFRAEYPDVPLHVIAMVEDSYRIEDILVVSWKRYLEELVEKYL
ncbi:MAG: ATP-binding protein [Nitrospina sp.]|nr:ATP-binding protein [Nitrospina sp.]